MTELTFERLLNAVRGDTVALRSRLTPISSRPAMAAPVPRLRTRI